MTLHILKTTSVLDWGLSIVTDDEITEVPSILRNLASTDSVMECVDDLGLAYPLPSLSVPPGTKVGEVFIRSVVQFQLTDTSYVVEIATYRIWEGNYAKVEPTSRCGVSFRDMAWDDNMAPVIGLNHGRSWDSEFEVFFPDQPGTRSGFLEFLGKVREVQKFLGSAMEAES